MTPRYVSFVCSKQFLAFLLLTATATAQTQLSTVAINDLIRQSVANELAAANSGGHYMYRLRKQTPRGSQTQDMVETRDWLIGRLTLKDGRPLPSSQRQQEDKRLRRLLTDQARLEQFQKEQHHDEARVHRIMRALPDAFLYEYEGTNDSGGGELVRLTFRPNPAFQPPSRELRVLQGMEGTMLIDGKAKRLARVEAKLVRDVDFGWGILGRLHRGGSFLLEQQDVGSGRWAIATLALRFSGKLLLLKSINIDSVTKASDFRRMPDDLTLEQGLDLLLKQDQMNSVQTNGKPR